jgi:predicted RNase H-like nuclease
LGVDLAWTARNGNGARALDADGRVVDERILVADDEILDWVKELASDSAVLAIDAPLLVPNETGRRPCESELSREYGSRWASTHPSNGQLLINHHGVIPYQRQAGGRLGRQAA